MKDLPKYNTNEWLSLEDFEGEEWKYIASFEKLYQISNYGRVKSLSRKCVNGRGGVYFSQNCILKYKNSRGYDSVSLCKNGKQYYFRVARLVAAAFIPNPNNYPHINHKDENTHNNCVDNLEWCTPLYNNNYGNHKKKISETRKRMFKEKPWMKEEIRKMMAEVSQRQEWKEKQRKAQMHNSKCQQVFQFSKQGVLIATYHSQKEAQRKTGIPAQNIGYNINYPNRMTHAGGYIWKKENNF